MGNQPDNHRSRWSVGITDHITPPADIEQQAFPGADFHFLSDWRATGENQKMWQQVDAILVWHWPVDRATLDVMDRCKIIVRYGVGFDLVDVPAVAERNIRFANTPDYGTEEVADTACGMILALQRKIVAYDRDCRHYTAGWQEHLLHPTWRTSERTLGLIGVGRIGTAVVNRMKPFGYRILGYDPYQPSGHEKAVGYHRVDSLSDLLRQADIVSVHCPLTEETRGMMDEGFFRQMRPGSLLVNTARGGILADLDCLEQVLRSGHLEAAALDVLPDEPPKDHPLIRAWREEQEWIRGRLIIAPHSAYYSERASYEMRYKAAETARLYLVEGRLRNQVVP
jgi:D-3-phosphoglycerate dehydrogenase